MTTIQQGLNPLASVCLTNKEYHYLYIEGGDGLVAFFATLRNSKKTTVIKKVGKKGPIALIQFVTGLSRTIINKHFPTLLKLGMAQVHPNGNVAVRGRNWTNKELPGLMKRKLIPIIICEKFTSTKTMVAFVRVHSNILKQKSQIGKKAERIKLIEQSLLGNIGNLNNLKCSNRLVKKGATIKCLKANRLNSTISNLGFHKLNKGSHNGSNFNKSAGHYYKSKLLKRGLIIQNRNVVLAYPSVKSPKFLESLNEEVVSGGYFIGDKGIYYEDSPRIEIGIAAIVGSKKKQVKK